MRCPECQFVGSDSRDICPKCFIDLRPHKKRAGLSIADESASYEALLVPFGDAVPPEVKVAARKKKSGVFSSIFRKPKAAAQPPTIQPTSPAPLVEKPKDVRARPASRKVEPPMISQETRPVAAPQPTPPPKPPPRPPAILKSSIFKSFPLNEDGAAVAMLYDECSSEMQTLSENTGVELTPEYFAGPTRDPAVEALYNLAFEVVQSPELEAQLVESIETSLDRKVEAKDLQKELARVEKRIALPMIGLRAFKDRAAVARQEEIAEPVREVCRASAPQQLTSLCIDAVVGIVAAVICMGAFLFVVDRDFLSHVSVASELEEWDFIAVSALLLFGSTLAAVLYPLLSLSIFRKTLGQYWCELRVVTELGRRPRPSHIAVRSLSAPLSYILFGYVPLLFKKRSLHDRWARTMVTSE